MVKKIEYNTTRLIHFDLLRIFAVFCMMLLHIAAKGWKSFSIDTWNWQICNIYNSSVRFCVPIFVMVSGTFLLNNSKQYSLKQFLEKKIIRLIIAFLFWSTSYSVLTNLIKYRTFNINVLKNIIKRAIAGHYHLWFLFMIIGLYLIVPFLRKFTEDKKLLKYFIFLSFLFSFIIIPLKNIDTLRKGITVILEQVNFYFALGYSGYFVLGYYLNTYSVKYKKRLIFLGGGRVLL